MNISNRLTRVLESLDCPVSRDLLASDNTEKGDYLGCKGGFLTYLPTKNAEVETPWASKYRVRGKAGKIARTFCTREHSDRDYENFYNGVVGLSFGPENLSIEKGDAIMDIYLNQKDIRKQSRMMGSCMTNNVSDENFKLYTENPDKVRLLVMWDTFKGKRVAIGRCLLWKTDQGLYTDRIYGSEPAIAYMRSYIKGKGWKSYGAAGSPLTVTFEGQKRYRVMPYLDTFRHAMYHSATENSYLTT